MIRNGLKIQIVGTLCWTILWTICSCTP